ncbi:MAG: LuxR C-terminal-related transcriptional regulator [Fretibacterium sp.]|nr:LuxR C-terminal-related transcriptional regulator [Fretibacterium sp.]
MLSCIYLHIQLAGANLAIRRREDAVRELETAMSLAAPDRLWLPFAENGPYIRELLGEIKLPKKLRAAVLSMTDRFIEARESILKRHFPVRWDTDLTEREIDVAKLAARRLSGREIAENLHLSENTVKTHLKHVYEKLGINGTERNKRASLERIIG